MKDKRDLVAQCPFRFGMEDPFCVGEECIAYEIIDVEIMSLRVHNIICHALKKDLTRKTREMK